MKQVLIAGCSYVESIGLNCTTENNKYTICGQPGAGNSLIAQTILDQISRQHFDQVIVLWSGVNRIDLPFGELAEKIMPDFYRRWSKKIGDTFWISSGGKLGSWRELPDEFSGVFKRFYLTATEKYLSDLTLTNIVLVQNTLKAKSIPCKMSFIYDTACAPSDRRDYSSLHCFGQLAKDSQWYSVVDWSQFNTAQMPIYNWAKQHQLFEDDGIHPWPDSIRTWLQTNFELDI